MFRAFRESLMSFLGSSSPAVAASPRWFVSDIRQWSASPDWRMTARRLAPDEQVAVMARLGHAVFDDDLGNYRTALEFNTHTIGGLGGSRARRELLREHCAFLFVSLLDALVLSDDRARTEAFENVELVGYQHAETALKSGRGAILLGCLQTHTGFGVRHPRLAQWKVTMVRPAAASDAYGPRWAEDCYGETVDFAPISPEGLARLLEGLKCNGCVAVQNDFSYPQTVGLSGILLGRPALVSRSLVKLILRTRAPVLPVNVVRLQPFSSRKIRVEIHPPLPFDDLAECKPDRESAALRLSVATECLIRRYPVQWTHWTALAQRWQEAQSIGPSPRLIDHRSRTSKSSQDQPS